MPDAIITNEQLQEVLGSLTEAKEKMEETASALEEKLSEIKEEVAGDAKEAVADAAEKAKKAFDSYKTLDTRLTEFIQKSERAFVDKGKAKTNNSAGYQVTNGDKYKTFIERGKTGSFNMKVKAITNITGAALLDPDTSPELVGQPEPQLMIRDLLPKNTTQKDSVKFVYETLMANSAGSVAQGATKPTTDFAWATKTLPVVTIAHLTKVSLQMLDDVPWLETFLNSRMNYLLKDAEDRQLLYGDTSSDQLEGIMTIATPYEVAMLTALGTTNATRIDELLAASTSAHVTGKYPATAYVLHPMDWAKLLAVKDTTGRYLLGNPDSEAAARLWDLPVVKSFNMQLGNFLTGAFNFGSELADRQDANIMISTENTDDFEKNMATIRAEERCVLLNYRPAVYVGGAFTI